MSKFCCTEKFYALREQAEQGDANAQFQVGKYCQYDYELTEAVKWYRKAAEQGNSDAQISLGSCYQFGRGVNKDYAEAEKWYLKAIEQGSSLAKRVFEGFNNLRSKS